MNINIKRSVLLTTKGQISNLPLFNSGELTNQELEQLDSKLTEILSAYIENKGDKDANT